MSYKNMHKDLKVTVLGKTYRVVTDEDEDCVVQAAALVDLLLKKSMGKAPTGSELHAAIMVSLKIATDATRQRLVTEKLEARYNAISALLDEAMI